MRTDIQALRGIAVAFVLFYHAGIGGVTAGYLGVDIFFVISGFLITGLVRDRLASGTFSFREFYARRARRLLPAAFVVLAASAAVSGYFLTPPEQQGFHVDLMASLLFAANISLLVQVDYFADPADLKPLLHMWSLAIEEQYYALLPVSLFCLPPRWWGPVWIVVVAASLVACLILQPYAPSAAFYLLPTRAWELGLGSLGALYATRLQSAWQSGWQSEWIVQKTALPALAVLIVIPFFPTGAPHPGLDALLVCTATLVLLLRRQDTQWLPVQMLARLGDLSYSLYLVHWPLFAFAQNVYVSSTIPGDVRAGLLLLSLVLAYALYRLVEAPCRVRDWRLDWQLAGRGALVAGLISVLPPVSAIPWADRTGQMLDSRPNTGFSPLCAYGTTFFARPECRSSEPDRVGIVVWGDSFAMHLVPGLVSDTGPGIEQATTEACGPLLGLAPRNNADYTRAWAEFCLSFNDSVVDHIAKSPAEIVVLSTAIAQYVEASARVLSVTADGLEERPGQSDLALERLAATVGILRAAGKRIIVVSAPPRASYNLSACLLRQQTGRLVRGYFTDCRMNMDIYRQAAPATVAFFERLETEADIPVLRLERFMCEGAGCLTQLDGTTLYRDRMHLSVEGSRKLAQVMDWLGEVQLRAR